MFAFSCQSCELCFPFSILGCLCLLFDATVTTLLLLVIILWIRLFQNSYFFLLLFITPTAAAPMVVWSYLLGHDHLPVTLLLLLRLLIALLR